jgi:hypothetical protein
LSQVWLLDSTYVCFFAEWMQWLKAKPSLRIAVFYRRGTGTAKCGKRFMDAARTTGGRLTATWVTEGHCEVPARRLPALLNPSLAPAVTREIDEEIDEEQAEEFDAEYDEELDDEYDEELTDLLDEVDDEE